MIIQGAYLGVLDKRVQAIHNPRAGTSGVNKNVGSPTQLPVVVSASVQPSEIRDTGHLGLFQESPLA